MIAAFALLCALLAQAPSAAVDPALATAVSRFFETQQKEDVAGYLALWSSTATPPRPEQLKYIFDSGDDAYSDLTIERVFLNGTRARVRVNITRQRTVPARTPGGAPIVFSMPMSITLAYEKDGDDWRLLTEGPAVDDLAASLLETKDDGAREALLATEPDLSGQPLISSLARLAGAAAVHQEYAEARRIYEALIFAARRGGFTKEHGEALQNIANAFYFERRYPEALTAYEQRLALERERQDDGGIASALAGIATIRYSYAEYGEALARYQEALALHEKTDDVAGIAFVSQSIGNIALLQGDFPAAIAAYRRSLDLNRTMSSADGESRALEGLGRVYMAQGDYVAALSAFDAVRTDKRMATARGRLAAVTQNIGEVHVRLGNLDAARASYEESRSHFEAAGDLPNVGRVLQGLAFAELLAARFAVAEELYKKSGAICSAAEDGDCSARAISGLAFAQAAQDKFWDAAASYRKAIEAFHALGRREEEARSEIGLAQALTGAGDFAGGVQAAGRARSEAVILDKDDVLWRALTAEARAVRKLGDRDRALGVARAAIAALDTLELASIDKPATSLPADATGALATYAVLQAESGNAQAAFDASERLRAVDLRAALATNERDIARGMTPEEREEERKLATAVSTLIARVTREKGLPKPDAARLAALQQSLDEASKARRAWIGKLYERLPDLAAWRGIQIGGAPVDFDQLLPDSRSLVVSFVLDEEALLILTARRAPTPAEGEAPPPPGPALSAHVVPVKRRQIAELVASMHQRALNDAAAWRKTAGELVALLPVTVIEQLQAASTVAIVPHESLWRVPFEALPIGDGYLADRSTVVVGGSAAMLARAAAARGVQRTNLTLVGSPVLAPNRIERLRQVAPAWSVRSGEDAGRELQAVSALQPADSATVLSGVAATERAAREAAAGAAILHIGAPFRINVASPLFSSILLAGADTPATEPAPATPETPAAPRQSAVESGDDGALELREVMNLSSAARLTVLSDGSATSMRDSAAAADVVEWGWLAAGVPALLIARWAPPPAARDQLFAEFYKRIRAGDSAAAAWSAAQRLVRALPEAAAPVHWAGWMLIGAPR